MKPRLSVLSAAMLVICGAIASAVQAQNLKSQRLNDTLVQDANPVYLVYMNPFKVQEYEQEAINRGYVRPEVPSIILDEEKINYVMRNIKAFSYSPGVERLKNEITNNLSLRNVAKAAVMMPAFYANLNQREVDALRNSNNIVSIDRLDPDEKAHTFSAPVYYDYFIGNEIVPWGKQAIKADNSITPNNYFFIADAKLIHPKLSSEVNIAFTDDEGYDGTGHAASVLALAAAKSNNAYIRGINPGQKIMHFGVQPYDWSISDKIIASAWMAEAFGVFRH